MSTNIDTTEGLDAILTYLVDDVELMRHRVEMRNVKPADAFNHNERFKAQAKQAIDSLVIQAKIEFIDSFIKEWYGTQLGTNDIPRDDYIANDLLDKRAAFQEQLNKESK